MVEDELKNPVEDVPKESRVGKKLSDKTTKKVILLVLIIIFLFGFFDTGTYNFPKHL